MTLALIVVIAVTNLAWGTAWVVRQHMVDRRMSTIRSEAERVMAESRTAIEAAERHRNAAIGKMRQIHARNAELEKWAGVVDAEAKAREIVASAEAKLEEARAVVQQAEQDARRFLADAERSGAELRAAAEDIAKITMREGREKAKSLADEAATVLSAAGEQSAKIIAEAHGKAEQIAGEAYEALRNADRYSRIARAMKNVIEGYGDEYLIPAESLLDDLAEDFGHKEAGQKLKVARSVTKALIKSRSASRCDYVQDSRREGAESFVLDAFNGKIDSILSRVRHDNYGKLAEEIKDAFVLVNDGGKAFREARITDEFLAARLEELKWGTVAQELRRQEQEEQRQLREQIREEQKAQREYERAIREAAKEEDVLRKAMAKAQAQLLAATEEQRVRYESQLADLNLRLQEAEERNERALSMAQQTRRGHVYIISNVGSFGDHVYKIGLTRRLEPLDRIYELGDSSVPFDFDVHALILSDDAPDLECKLHKHFLLNQINKVNHRKEFFRANLADLRRELETMGVEAKWTMRAEAAEFRETLAIEKAIKDDPNAREAWIKRQLTLDPTDFKELVATEEDE
jgi:hypothetical protein